MFGLARKKINLLIDLFENIDELVFEINSRDSSKDLLIFLITEKQLFEKGEDGNGNSLGEYSPFTIEIKRAKNQPFDRVTLRDKGDFYESFDIVVKKDEIVIIADTIKDDKDLAEIYGKAIIKPSKTSLGEYRAYMLPLLLQLIRKEVGAIRGLSR